MLAIELCEPAIDRAILVNQIAPDSVSELPAPAAVAAVNKLQLLIDG